MKHLHIVDTAPVVPPVELSAWMAEKVREFEAEVVAARASWGRPRHLRVAETPA